MWQIVIIMFLPTIGVEQDAITVTHNEGKVLEFETKEVCLKHVWANVDKLKEQLEAEIPMILKNDMVIQFHEERLIDLEERKNGNH